MLHSWNLKPAEAVRLQRDLSSHVRLTPLEGRVRQVAGVDCTFVERDGEPVIIAGAVLCDARTKAVLETACVARICTFPYISGLLSFREAPAVLEALESLSAAPDLVMCDGQGIAHPRRLGLASHVGLWLGSPTIGVAKSLLCGRYRVPGQRRGCGTRLLHKGEVVGRVVRTRTGVRPVFVSPGHLIDHRDATRWSLRMCTRYRLPEPTRQAHHLVTRLRRPPRDGVL